MANEIVCYKNDMNLIPMRSFNSVEMDLFFSICSQMKEKGIDVITLPFNSLKTLSDYKPTSKQRLITDIENVYRKLLSLQFYESNDLERGGFVLFTSYKIDLVKEDVKIKINSDFEYILNRLSEEFTKFELKEFTNLKSSYSKTGYRLLKQFKSTGYRRFEMEQFRELMCVPKSYKMSHINDVVLKPMMEELSYSFKELRIKKIKEKKGRKITHIEFYFKAEKKEKIEITQEDKIADLVTQEKITTIKNAISNLDDEHIKILLDLAEVPVVLEKYFKFAVGKDIENLTGFLISAIKNDWKTVAQAEKEFKKETGEMDELEAKLQKRFFERKG